MILVQVTMFQCDALPCLKYSLRNYCDAQKLLIWVPQPSFQYLTSVSAGT